MRTPPPKTRRSLTQASQPAPIRMSGHAKLAAGLARALDVGTADARMLTHGFHTYPARLHPLTARRLLALLEAKVVLDPFCGSGTVLVEAIRGGIRSFGVDANPLAILVANAKTWGGKPARRRELLSRANKISERAVAEGKAARRSGYEAPPLRPMKDDETSFAPHVRRELETLAWLVAQERDQEIVSILRAVLSSILVKMSTRSSDTSGEKVERKLARGMAARLFAGRAGELVEGLNALWDAAPPNTPTPSIFLGDARKLPKEMGKIDTIVSSPPYVGTYDYLEHHKLRLDFLGIDTTSFADAEIGARRRFAGGKQVIQAALSGWDRDLGAALAEMARVLAPGGRAALVIGDSFAGRPLDGVAVHADDVIARLAPPAGLEVVATASIERQTFGRAESVAFEKRPKSEHVILIAKPR